MASIAMFVRGAVLVTFCGIAASSALAQNQPQPAPKPQPVAPADQKTPVKSVDGNRLFTPKEAKPQQPLTPEQEAWAKANEPNEHHKRLGKAVGIWDGKGKMWAKAGAEPTEVTLLSNCTFVAGTGERFTRSDVRSMTRDFPFQGSGVYGYNNATGKFESTWIDGMSTGMLFMTGASSGDGTITWTGSFTDPMTKKEKKVRAVEKLEGDEKMTFEMYVTGDDGKEFRSMQVDYARRNVGRNRKGAEGQPVEATPAGKTPQPAPAQPVPAKR